MLKHLGDLRTNPTLRRPFGSGPKSPFVGRDEELRRLSAALNRAAEAQGSIVFLTGQPGIGKTRLARETLALAKKCGFTALEGRAFPFQAGLAYAPFLDAFSPLLRSLSSSRLKALVSGLPDLGRLFGELRLPQPEHLGDPALEKTRLFESVYRLLERLTQEAPVALFIDDVHWADPASVELLHYLARGLADQRALLLATYGLRESDTACGLHSLLVPLQRRGLAEEISVPPLEPEAVDKLVRGILEDELPSHLPALLNARARGTPLFIEAVIDALIDSHSLIRDASGKNGWVLSVEGTLPLPPSVRHLILERLERLPSADRHVLDLIAVLGDATPFDILAAASGLDEETLVAVLCRLLALGLLAEGKDGSDVTYSITHPLVQEVAYAEQPEIVRGRAHLVAIEAIERRSEGRLDDASRLAAHYLGAGPLAKGGRALAALVGAGERALSVYANEEAARHFEAALAVLRRRGEEALSPLSPPPPSLSSLLERLGEAWERIGKREAAIEVWREALVLLSEGLERASDDIAAARLGSRLALAEWDSGHFDVSDAYLAAALAALAGRETCEEMVDLHLVRVLIHFRIGDVAALAQSAGELLSVAERLRSPRAQAAANEAASMLCLWQNDITGARERAVHALMKAEGAQDLRVCCAAHAVLANVGVRLGDHQFARYHAERGQAVARRLGVPQWRVIFWRRSAFANFVCGAWETSLQDGLAAIALARRIGSPRDLASSLGERAVILALRGDLSEAEACISEARIAFGSPSGRASDSRAVFGLIDIAQTALALQREQVEQALGIARGFMNFSTLAATSAPLAAGYLPTCLMLLAEAQTAAGDPQSAMETARALTGLGPPGTSYLDALACRAEGLARQALGQTEAAIACLTRACGTFSALEMPFEAARSSLEQAAVMAAVQPGAAATAAQQSLATFERLGAQRYARRARRLLQGLGIPLLETRHLLGGVPMSERELQIARLVSQGLTTAQIAKQLTISLHTVDAHLYRMYARLGVGSRASLCRLVIEAGLLSP